MAFEKHFVPPTRAQPSNYVYSPTVFNVKECERIIAENKMDDAKWATVGDGTEYHEDLKYRAVKHTFLSQEETNNDWIYQRIHDEIVKINQQFWNFDLTAMSELVQVLRYDASDDATVPAGHYNWHQDYGNDFASLRKISVVVNLSDPTTYDGCALTIFTNSNYTVKETDPGTMITFPSYIPHMVSSIDRGTRYALVTWISGPPFR